MSRYVAVLALTPIRPHTSGSQYSFVLSLHSYHRWLAFCNGTSKSSDMCLFTEEKHPKHPKTSQRSSIFLYTFKDSVPHWM